MDDKINVPSKPLRSTSNKLKDLFNTYLKNQGLKQYPQAILENDKPQKSNEDEESKKNLTYDQKEGEQIELTEDQEIIGEFINKFEELIKEKDELQDQAKRLAAEFENFRRRSIKEKQEMIDYANERLLFKLLPIIDDFEAAISSGKQANDASGLLTGVEMIYQKTLKVFDEAGIKQMPDPVGKPFDVDYHEALALTPSELPEGYITQQLLPGYMIQNKVLRHAKVFTSSGKNANENFIED